MHRFSPARAGFKSTRPLNRAVIESIEKRVLMSVTLTTLANFDGPTGSQPTAGVALDGAGNVYGVTQNGGVGDNAQGVLFMINGSTGVYSTLATFGGALGEQPSGTPVIDSGGNIFGSTAGGGTTGHGVIYEYCTSSAALTTLSTFVDVSGSAPELDGADPYAGILRDSVGNIFGTSVGGGDNAVGTVYELPAGSGNVGSIGAFDGVSGTGPKSGLVSDSAGDLFGTAVSGGTNGAGTVFEIPAGGTLAAKASFNTTNGANPIGGLVLDSSGNLYGTTQAGGPSGNGTVFEIAAGGTTITDLATFDGGSAGGSPIGGLTIDSGGNLFGTTSSGGTGSDGTIFKVSAGSHTLSTVYNFSGLDGANPQSTLVFDSAGNLYGTTQAGGTNNVGTVFKLSGLLDSDKLVVTSQPSTTVIGTAIAPAVTVTEDDASGNVVTGDNSSSVTVALAGGSSAGTLGGTVTAPMVNGVATFSNLIISAVGSYSLSFTDGSITPTTSSTFSVTMVPSTLTPAFVKSTLPSAVVAGAAVKGQALVLLTNGGSVLTGPVTVGVYATTTGTVDSSAVLIGSTPKKLNKLKTGGTVKVTVAIKSLPAGLSGNYTLVAQVTDPADLTAATTNGPALTAAAPVIAFADSFVRTTLGTAVVSGTKTKAIVQIKVTNNGNVISKGTSTAEFGFSTDGQSGDATLLSAVKLGIVLKPGQSRVVSLPLKTLPAVADGNYNLVAALTDPDGNVTQVASPGAYTLAAPFTKLTPSRVSEVVAKNSTATVTFTITNSGNITPVGSGTINLLASTDGTIANGVTVYTKLQAIPIAAGRSKVYKIRLTAAQVQQVLLAGQLVVQVIDPSGASLFAAIPVVQ